MSGPPGGPAPGWSSIRLHLREKLQSWLLRGFGGIMFSLQPAILAGLPRPCAEAEQ